MMTIAINLETENTQPMEKTKKTHAKIRAKIDAIKKINDQPVKTTDDLYDLLNSDKLAEPEVFLRRKLDDYKDKKKAKKTEKKDIFSELMKTADGFLGTDDATKKDTKLKPYTIHKLKKYSILSASTTLHSSKQIVMDTVKNNLFSGEGVCGSNNLMPFDTLTLEPKEFDFLNMLKVAPDSTSGKIMYEADPDKGFVKMNTKFYTTFDSGSPYFFNNKNGDSLFNITWNEPTQSYTVAGLKGVSGVTTVQEFLTDYYSSIEFPDIENIIKQSMLMLLGGDGGEPQSFINGQNQLDRLLQKLFSMCGQKTNPKPMNQNTSNLINEDDDDLEWYFDFDDVEGIDLDDESNRHRRVLKFRDCDNFEVPTNTNHIEDFVYFTKKGNINENVDNALNNVANEAYESAEHTISLENLLLSIIGMFVKTLPKAIISSVISPKVFFPITVLYKSFKGLTITAMDILKKLKKMFNEIITQLFWKFIKEFWGYLKKDLLAFVAKISATILLNKVKRYKKILMSLITLLIKLLKSNLDSCEAIFEAILATIDSALNAKVKIPIPAILLVLSDKLPGYSADRAYMNVLERLSASGVQMGDLYGRENKLNSVVKSILDGHTEEMDENSFIKIALQPTSIAVAPGGLAALITPTVSGVGKLF
jgi:hypothetical protein